MKPHIAYQPADVGARHVLVVDDDPGLCEVLREELEERGYVISTAATAKEAIAAVERRQPDAVLLDLGLPDLSGLDLLTQLTRYEDVAVLVISGRGGEIDRCVGLESGADDYLVKPFSIRELTVRVDHAIGRTRQAPEPVIQHGSLRINLATREVFVDEREVELTAKEFDLLVLLASSPRRVFGREQILGQVWHSSLEWQSTGTVSEHVHRLRRKLDPAERDRWIVTRRGLGYRFSP